MLNHHNTTLPCSQMNSPPWSRLHVSDRNSWDTLIYSWQFILCDRWQLDEPKRKDHLREVNRFSNSLHIRRLQYLESPFPNTCATPWQSPSKLDKYSKAHLFAQFFKPCTKRSLEVAEFWSSWATFYTFENSAVIILSRPLLTIQLQAIRDVLDMSATSSAWTQD